MSEQINLYSGHYLSHEAQLWPKIACHGCCLHLQMILGHHLLCLLMMILSFACSVLDGCPSRCGLCTLSNCREWIWQDGSHWWAFLQQRSHPHHLACRKKPARFEAHHCLQQHGALHLKTSHYSSSAITDWSQKFFSTCLKCVQDMTKNVQYILKCVQDMSERERERERARGRERNSSASRILLETKMLVEKQARERKPAALLGDDASFSNQINSVKVEQGGGEGKRTWRREERTWD